MTWAELKQAAVADFKNGKLTLLALGVLLTILDAMERSGLTLDEVRGSK